MDIDHVLKNAAPPVREMIWVASQSFVMGSDEHHPEEAPARRTRVDGFWIDAVPVTNQAFTAFVAATGYVTVAERPLDPAIYPGADPLLLTPGSIVFVQPEGAPIRPDQHSWWKFVQGACWRRPYGRDSSLHGLEQHPVVHVAYDDAIAYAHWCGKDLPTEAEWECAARGGLEQATYAWGNDFKPGGAWQANTWQGAFPTQNSCEDGYGRTSPVATYPSNGYGLFDMAGNVWEWTADWYAGQPRAGVKPCCTLSNPRGATESASLDPTQPEIRIPRKVLKGGSFLCAPSYCDRYRPAARQPQMVDSASCHIGFRCVRREQPDQR